MHLVGYDQLGRPIIYSCLALAGNRVYEDNKDHMIQTFEMVSQQGLVEPSTTVEHSSSCRCKVNVCVCVV